MYKCVLNC